MLQPGSPESGGTEAFDILGMGMSMMDSIQQVEEFPAESGVTEVIEGVLMGGGPVPTALCAAARLGARAGIVDRVGGDWRGDLIREDYERFGVDTRFLRQEGGKTSSFGTVLVRRRDGERHIVFQRGDFSILGEEEIPAEALRSCRILHLNGRHWPACVEAARIVRASGGLVSFDGGANRYDPKFLDLLGHVDILVVARDFAVRLSGEEDHEAQLESLGRWNAGIVGITDGERGSWFRERDGSVFHQAAFAVDGLVDTTGCGDVFHGAFLAAAIRGEAWRECARFASAAAALGATALGGRGNLPGRGEVEALVGGQL